MWKKGIKWLTRIIISILLFVCLYFLAAILLALIPDKPEKTECDNKQRIYLVSNGIHVNLVLPVENIKHEMLTRLPLPIGTRYLSFGWGDRRFYLETPTWNELQIGVVMRALFSQTETAMHIGEYTYIPDDWASVDICPAQFTRLEEYLANSFDLDENGDPILIPDSGYTENDRFYEGLGNYTFLFTCNNWVNRALKQVDIKTAAWSPFEFGIMRYVD